MCIPLQPPLLNNLQENVYLNFIVYIVHLRSITILNIMSFIT